jgi:VCBS repeat-containing protein
VTTTIDVIAVNDAPQETVAAAAAYTENAPPVTLSPAALASDVDNLNLAAGIVSIASGFVDGDVLTVNGQQSGTFAGIDFAYDAGRRALAFTRPEEVADYQTLMQAVQFQSTSDNPTNFGANPTRTLAWGLHDGTDYTDPVQFTELVITALDDPAVAQNDAVATTEDAAITAGNVFANNGSGLDNDPDGGAFLVTAVSGGTVGTQFALASGALLTLSANGTFSYDPNQLFDYLPAAGSGASNLTVTDTFSYTITGGDTATVTLTISGVDTNDVLYDSAVDDTLAGGIGDDVYYASNTGDLVTEAAGAGFDTVAAFVNYTLPASNTVEVLNMIGAGLTGEGSDGAETFISSSGPNTLRGFGGNDTYYVNSAADMVIEEAGDGIDTVEATVDYTMPANAEGLYMLGSGLTGRGTANADSLLSSGGPNTLEGLDGDDLYYVNNASDRVIEEADGGFDSVMTSVSYTLPDNVEALYVNGSALTGTGNSGANTLVTVGANTLIGGDGDDTFVFFAGSANDATVEDFNRNQVDEWDFLVFSGFGTGAQGATISPVVGTTDQWQIHSGLDGHDETITFSNHAALQAGDWVFV